LLAARLFISVNRSLRIGVGRFLAAFIVCCLFSQPARAYEEDQIDPGEFISQVQSASSAIKKLIRDYESTDDQLVLGCLRDKQKKVKVIEASLLGDAAKMRRVEVNIKHQMAATMAESVQAAEKLAADARKCLQIQDGEITDYSNQDALPAPNKIPDLSVPVPADSKAPDIDIEPEPCDRPLSNMALACESSP